MCPSADGFHFLLNSFFCLFSLPSARSRLQSSVDQVVPLNPGANRRLLIPGKHHFHCNTELSCSDKPRQYWVCPFQRIRSISVTSHVQKQHPGKHMGPYINLFSSLHWRNHLQSHLPRSALPFPSPCLPLEVVWAPVLSGPLKKS